MIVCGEMLLLRLYQRIHIVREKGEKFKDHIARFGHFSATFTNSAWHEMMENLLEK